MTLKLNKFYRFQVKHEFVWIGTWWEICEVEIVSSRDIG